MKYSKEKIDECAQWVRVNGLVDFGGATKKSLCAAMDITAETLNQWERKAEFAEAIKKAKDEFKGRLETDLVQSLAKCAKGYTYTRHRSEFGEKNGKPYLKKKVTEDVDVQPNVGAAIFLLTNIAPERWKNRQTQDVKADVKAETNANGRFDIDLPEDVVMRIADEVQQVEHDKLKEEKENE